MQRFTQKAIVTKAVNTLLGIIEGIAADSYINQDEFDYLQRWLDENLLYIDRHPFNELAPVVKHAMADHILTIEEKEEITWLCNKLVSESFGNILKTDMQRLQAIIGAIACDLEVNEKEVLALRKWLNEHSHLKTVWPYDEVDSVITHVLADSIVTAEEQKQLVNFFNEFTAHADDKTITNPLIKTENISGLCAVCPDIFFKDMTFTITGESYKYNRREFVNVLLQHGAKFSKNVTQQTDYLIIGSEGNPCWAFSCYGRKVERAVELRKQGFNMVIVHENDLHDALDDL